MAQAVHRAVVENNRTPTPFGSRHNSEQAAHRGVRLDDQPRELIELVWAIAAVIRQSEPMTWVPWANSDKGQRGASVVLDSEQAAQALVDAGYRRAASPAKPAGPSAEEGNARDYYRGILSKIANYNEVNWDDNKTIILAFDTVPAQIARAGFQSEPPSPAKQEGGDRG